ncbi:hypothetical protein O181_020923 [Austropuccinia psidii MF-1]|uniref:Uncharacterized protein n=1 Tax=Austropuccinia psidii MF-1 TaxID=1389203 RepID=A0A9Q3GUY9_9BASI|nr:hypothetical protein [Austropuccinia psidii MF-1]
MPVQNSPSAKNTKYQRNKAVFTPTARSSLGCMPSVHELSANLDRGPPIEEEPSRRGGFKLRRSTSFSGFLGGYPGNNQGTRSRLGEAEDEEGQEPVEEENSKEAELEAALVGSPETSEAPNLALSNQLLVPQAEPNFLKMMQKMTQFIGKFTQEVSPRGNSRHPAFKTPSMKAPDLFDGTQAHKLRGLIQYCQLLSIMTKTNLLMGRRFLNKLLFSLVELEDGLNHTSQISPMKTLPTSSITGSFLKTSYSFCLVIPMKSGKLKNC